MAGLIKPWGPEKVVFVDNIWVNASLLLDGLVGDLIESGQVSSGSLRVP